MIVNKHITVRMEIQEISVHGKNVNMKKIRPTFHDNKSYFKFKSNKNKH